MHILLIEDDVHISRELQLRWRARTWCVNACGTLEDADQALRGRAFDLVVLDLQLPDGDGLVWLRQARAGGLSTAVLVLTARDRVADRVNGLQSGADDYLIKPFAPEELDARVEALLRRLASSAEPSARFGALVWQREESLALLDGVRLNLHPREFEVLGLLVRRAPRLVSKRVIVEALAERNLDVGDGAAEVYVSRLRRKLQGSTVQIETVRGFGYRLQACELGSAL
ncbi:MAG: response regulator transcription factor [Proteobacteria bacterium]|uniref:response regulator n=1 Tax=Aquabacterium sp. TaxID=1872578 RepID=UPI0035C76755|nr:response regulator transcription factor [Pseudomonadota bacterium]